MIPIRVQMTVDRPPGVAIRKWKEILRGAHQDQATLWHQKFLPQHFTTQARRKYKHTPRKRSTAFRKQALAKKGLVQKGGMVDNVHSGVLERMQTHMAKIRGYPSRGTVTMAGPRYITMRPRSATAVNKAREITMVTADEGRELSEFLEATATARLNSWKESKKFLDTGSFA